MRMKKPSKKLLQAQAFFQRNVSEFVESIGAVAQACGYAKQYVLQTSIGQLEITVFENWIAGRFADSCAAAVFGRRNGPPVSPTSGKLNFFYDDNPVTLNNGLIIGNFVLAVNKLLAYTPTPEDAVEAARLRTMIANRFSI